MPDSPTDQGRRIVLSGRASSGGLGLKFHRHFGAPQRRTRNPGTSACVHGFRVPPFGGPGMTFVGYTPKMAPRTLTCSPSGKVLSAPLAGPTASRTVNG